MPSGRYISGVTNGVRFIGVCIPWRDAHVRTGRKDRLPWDDHEVYLKEIKPILQKHLSKNFPVCMLGDFNQRIPRQSQPVSVYSQLTEIIDLGFNCITSSDRVPGNPLIDHLIVDCRILADFCEVIPKEASDGVRLSDHDGILCKIQNEPNKALEPTIMAVTFRAPSSTKRASHDRGSV
jgi:hypothetical protein